MSEKEIKRCITCGKPIEKGQRKYCILHGKSLRSGGPRGAEPKNGKQSKMSDHIPSPGAESRGLCTSCNSPMEKGQRKYCLRCKSERQGKPVTIRVLPSPPDGVYLDITSGKRLFDTLRLANTMYGRPKVNRALYDALFKFVDTSTSRELEVDSVYINKDYKDKFRRLNTFQKKFLKKVQEEIDHRRCVNYCLEKEGLVQNHDHSKDCFYITMMIFFFNKEFDVNSDGTDDKTTIIESHYKAEPHHPEHMKYSQQLLRDEDLNHMSLDRICRNLQFNKGKIDYITLLQTFAPTFVCPKCSEKCSHPRELLNKYFQYLVFNIPKYHDCWGLRGHWPKDRGFC